MTSLSSPGACPVLEPSQFHFGSWLGSVMGPFTVCSNNSMVRNKVFHARKRHGLERNDVNKTTHPCFAPEVYAGSSNPAQKRRHQKGAKLAQKTFELAQQNSEHTALVTTSTQKKNKKVQMLQISGDDRRSDETCKDCVLNAKAILK